MTISKSAVLSGLMKFSTMPPSLWNANGLGGSLCLAGRALLRACRALADEHASRSAQSNPSEPASDRRRITFETSRPPSRKGQKGVTLAYSARVLHENVITS